MNTEFTSRNKCKLVKVAVKMDADGLIWQFGIVFSKVGGCASRFPLPTVMKRKIRVFLRVREFTIENDLGTQVVDVT